MIKRIVAASALAIAISSPALADLDRHQNASLEGYVGHATAIQYQQPTAFDTVNGVAAAVEPVGPGNASLEAFNPNAVDAEPTRFQTAPSVANKTDFTWIDQPDIGA